MSEILYARQEGQQSQHDTTSYGGICHDNNHHSNFQVSSHPFRQLSSFNLALPCDTSLVTSVSSQAEVINTTAAEYQAAYIKHKFSPSLSPEPLDVTGNGDDFPYHDFTIVKQEHPQTPPGSTSGSTTGPAESPSPMNPSTPHWDPLNVKSEAPMLKSHVVPSTILSSNMHETLPSRQSTPALSLNAYRGYSSTPVQATSLPPPQSYAPMDGSQYYQYHSMPTAPTPMVPTAPAYFYNNNNNKQKLNSRRNSRDRKKRESWSPDPTLFSPNATAMMKDDEKLLIRLRVKERLPWKRVLAQYKQETGCSGATVAALQMKKMRFLERTREWTQVDQRALEGAKNEVGSTGPSRSKWERLAKAMMRHGCKWKWTPQTIQKKYNESFAEPSRAPVQPTYSEQGQFQVQSEAPYEGTNWMLDDYEEQFDAESVSDGTMDGESRSRSASASMGYVGEQMQLGHHNEASHETNQNSWNVGQ